MRTLVFAGRNQKEIVRDVLSLIFCILLPVFLLIMMSIISKSAPVDNFKIENLTPGIVIFSFSFITLFSGVLVAKDRSNSFLTRLFASPMTSFNFIVGYTLPLLVVALVQYIVCVGVAMFFGYTITIHTLIAILFLLPVALFFVALGLLLGSIFSDKQVSGFTSIMINVATFISGIWFDISLIGGTFKKVVYFLPFAHAVDLARFAMSGQYEQLWSSLIWVTVYAFVICVIAIAVFKKKMKSDVV